MTFQQRVDREGDLLRVEVRRKRQVRQMFPVVPRGIPPPAVCVQCLFLVSVKGQVAVHLVEIDPWLDAGLPRGYRQFFRAPLFPEGDVGFQIFHHLRELSQVQGLRAVAHGFLRSGMGFDH